jgi:Holliday junction resolvase RusA-like endonuclease
MKVEFFIPGVPRTRSAKKTTVRGGKPFSYTPENSAEQEWFSVSRQVAHQNAPEKLLDGPLGQRLTFMLGEKPKSWKKRDTKPFKKPDLDNLEKLLNDALEKVIFVNDSRIVEKYVAKKFGHPPGVHVEVWEITDEA